MPGPPSPARAGRRITIDAPPLGAGPEPEPGAEDDESPASGPLRRCVVTRTVQPKARMIRFVVAPDRSVVPDLTARLPGRGLWLSARGDVIETARARGAFARAARGTVAVPADLPALVGAGLARRIVELLGLARRAGQAVCGFQKAQEWLGGRAGLVVQASDGSPDERARFLRGAVVPVIAPLPGARLGAVFGRDHVVHVAVAHGRLAEALVIEADRLAGFAGADDGSKPAGDAPRAME